jgi:hypothetical protein
MEGIKDKKMKNKIKAILVMLMISILGALISVLIIFIFSKFTGFEDHQLTPGGSTVGHPLITSYKIGILLFWRKFLYLFIGSSVFFFLISTSLYNDIIEKFERKDEKKKSKENNSLNENKNNEDSKKKSANGGRRTADKLS